MSTFHVSLGGPVADACRGGAVTIGNFDGVHRGHQALVAEAARQARQVAGPALAVTFDPHPLQLLRPQEFQPLLTTADYRAELLHGCGADHTVILSATRELLQLSAKEFFERVIRDHLQARAVVEGYNFGFGRNREGNADTLRDLCRQAGLELVLVPPVELEGRPISSSRVRDELIRGAVRAAETLLGRPYRICGRVGRGQHRGQTLGFPTANLENVSTLLPANGVYAVRVHHENKVWAGAANIGPNPTFGEHAHKIEVHLIDFRGELYAQVLAVDFIERLRDTRPFATVQELVEQLRKDVEQARRLLSG
jgi:riboflavin kinase/FMN adenylyltransferase